MCTFLHALRYFLKDKWIHPVTEEGCAPRGSFRNTLTGEPAVFPKPNNEVIHE